MQTRHPLLYKVLDMHNKSTAQHNKHIDAQPFSLSLSLSLFLSLCLAHQLGVEDQVIDS
jgi:hypothetical protein